MLAAEAAFDALAADSAGAELTGYPERLEASWLYDELHRVRNIKPVVPARGCGAASPTRRSTLTLFRGKAPWTLHHHADHA